MFKDISIRKKLITQTAVPIVIIMVLAIMNINFTYSKVQELNNIQKASKLLSSISLLVHETQKERGMTAGFIGSNGKNFRGKLPSQRKLTNNKLADLKKVLNTIDIKSIDISTFKTVNTALNSILKINEIRSKVDGLSIKESNAIAYYTNINTKFLNIIVKISNFSSSPKITKQIIAYLNFLLSKERAGIERAVGTDITSNDYFKPGFRAKFSSLIVAQNSYMDSFKDYSSKKEREFYNKMLNDKNVKEVERMRKIILNTKGIGGFDVDGTYWFKTISKKLGLLKKTEDNIVSSLRVSSNMTKNHIKIAVALSNLVHETQKERGATAGFIGSKGKKFANIVKKQRLNTNIKLKIAKKTLMRLGTYTLNRGAKNYLNKGLAQLSKLNNIRTSVDNFSIDGKKAIGYFTNMHAIFLNVIGEITKDAKTADEARDLLAWYNFIMAKERAGIERAVMSNTFAANKFLPGMKEKFTKLVTEQKSYLASFEKAASNSMINKYKSTVVGKSIDEVNRMRRIAFNATAIGGFNIDYNYWFDTTTAKINLLKKIDNHLSIVLVQTINDQLAQENKALYTIITIVLIIIIFILAFSKFVADGVTNAIGDFQNGLLSFFKYINKETQTIELLNSDSKDEMGIMARVVNENIIKTKNAIEEDNIFIKDTQTVMEKVQNGSFERQIVAKTNNPSLQLLKNTINDGLYKLREKFDMLNNILEQYSSYDYTNKLSIAEVKANSALGTLIVDINRLRDVITNMLIENKQNGISLDKSSDLLLENIDKLASNSNDSTIAIQNTVIDIDNVTKNIDNNTKNVIKMSENAQGLSDSATNGQKLASQTTLAMDEINIEVSSISDAISVIDQISFQTNILSLNAAVEAATAGEAGKGFAVVAQEVRNLASRSADAANEIKAIVGKANTKALKGKDIADEMIEGYTKLNDNISQTIALIKNVEKSSKEQQHGMIKINDTIKSLDNQTKENANIASQTQEVSFETDKIAKLIVSRVEEKIFIEN